MRLTALDSLRGIAAASVVVYHCLLVFPELHAFLDGRGVPYAVSGDFQTLLMTVIPPRLLWAGREAVLLFFVLSGFVLALAFEDRRRRPSYRAFAAKRVVRLILPSAAVVLVLAVAVPFIEPSPRPELSDWFNSSWTEPVTPGLVLRHALLAMDEYTLNNPMWTLHYELRVSLIFPLIALLAATNVPVTLAAALAGVVVCLAEMKLVGTGALTTLFFVPHFALGALLAFRREAIARRVSALPVAGRLALWIAAYLLLTFRWLVPAHDLVCDLMNGAGAALLIALVISSARAQAVLGWRPLVRLGEVSYSLYLVHVPVILAGLHLAPAWIPAWAVVAGVPPVSIALATLLYRSVEKPSMWLGRRVAAWLEPDRGRRTATRGRMLGIPGRRPASDP